MTASSVQVNSTGGTRLATNSYTEGAVTVHDEKVLLGEQYLPTYTFASSASIATANDHVVAINAGSSLNVYIRRIMVQQRALGSAANQGSFSVLRLTTLGSGGTSVAARPYDTTDGAAGATARTLDSSKGTEGGELYRFNIGIVSAQPVLVGDTTYIWEPTARNKAMRIPAGTANGIAIKSLTAITSATVTFVIEFDEASF